MIGSAFHTLLLATSIPECLYLCPSWGKGGYLAQHRFLDARATFSQGLEVADLRRRQRVSFPRGFRLLIPESLRAFRDSVLPDLLDDARLAAFADPARNWPQRNDGHPADDLDSAAARVMLEPLSIEARRKLAEMFAARGLNHCAEEQIAAIVQLSDEPMPTVVQKAP